MAEAIFLAAVLLGALVLFYTGWLRPDVTALLVMLSLMIPWRPMPGSGLAPILSVQQAFSGFGSPAVLMVASMFLLSAAMVRTGGAQLIGGWILSAGARSELLLQVTVLSVVTLFSAFVNDTTTVIIWMPLVLAVCRERGYSPTRLLILLAFASLLGGQWTLIGTRSNILISDYLRTRTGEGLGFFSFTPIAASIWIAVLAFFVLVGRRLLPARRVEPSLAERYEVTEYLTEVMTAPGAEIVGRSLGELDFAGRFGVTVLQIIRGKETLPPSSWVKIFPNDVLVIQGRISRITDLLAHPGLTVKEELKVGDKTLRRVDLLMVEAIVAPNSVLTGSTLDSLNFSAQHGLSVLAVGRFGRPLVGSPLSQRLLEGDSLLLIGHASEIQALRSDPNLLLLESKPLPVPGRSKAYLTIGLLAFVAVVSAAKILEPGFVIPLAAVLAILTGCIGMRQGYESLDLQALVVVGAMIPFGIALEQTNTAHLVAESVASALGPLGERAIFAAVLLFAILMTQVIENAAVAILLSPIAYELALASGANPAPFLLGVAICISTAFMTPIAHESTILVMAPGRYRFRDYLLAGTPLALIAWIVTVLVLPLIYPLSG
ncbi:MAG: SLC13 family permease [Candidatus Eisenbacteria bacterium]